MEVGATLSVRRRKLPVHMRQTIRPPEDEGLRGYHRPTTAINTAAESQVPRTITIKAMRIPVFHVDAFTNEAFRGNPAAVCPLQAWLDDETLRKVAAENNLSETAFIVPGTGSYELRWFSTRSEVKLCGHATLGAGYMVLNVLEPELDTVWFQTRHSGTLSVRKENSLLAMDFPALLPRKCTSIPDGLLDALRPAPQPTRVLEVNDIYIAVFEDETAIQNMRPDFSRLALFHPAVVAVTAPGKTVDFVSRYFKPSYGMPEDPVTGSAHCALTPYWAQRLGKAKLHARQLSERGGELWCQMAGDRVILKGHAVLTMQGTFEI
jgi:PhzF family phenazine biosynthesis protein